MKWDFGIALEQTRKEEFIINLISIGLEHVLFGVGVISSCVVGVALKSRENEYEQPASDVQDSAKETNVRGRVLSSRKLSWNRHHRPPNSWTAKIEREIHRLCCQNEGTVHQFYFKPYPEVFSNHRSKCDPHFDTTRLKIIDNGHTDRPRY